MELEQKDMETLFSTFPENIEDQQSQNLSQDDNVDFNKDSFIVDTLSFLLQNFNPINVERKLEMEKECDMVKFMWDECIPHEFVRYV